MTQLNINFDGIQIQNLDSIMLSVNGYNNSAASYYDKLKNQSTIRLIILTFVTTTERLRSVYDSIDNCGETLDPVFYRHALNEILNNTSILRNSVFSHADLGEFEPDENYKIMIKTLEKMEYKIKSDLSPPTNQADEDSSDDDTDVDDSDNEADGEEVVTPTPTQSQNIYNEINKAKKDDNCCPCPCVIM